MLGLAAALLALRMYGDCAAGTASFLHALGTAQGGVRSNAQPAAPYERKEAMALSGMGGLEHGRGD